MSSSSSTVPKKGRGGRGGVPPPSIFPKVVYPVEPGSPTGIEPPAANTIPMSFDKQNSKAAEKKNRHHGKKVLPIRSYNDCSFKTFVRPAKVPPLNFKTGESPTS